MRRAEGAGAHDVEQGPAAAHAERGFAECTVGDIRSLAYDLLRQENMNSEDFQRLEALFASLKGLFATLTARDEMMEENNELMRRSALGSGDLQELERINRELWLEWKRVHQEFQEHERAFTRQLHR